MGLLYNLDLTDKLEALLQGRTSSDAEAPVLMESMTSDSVMGPLT